MVNRNLVAGLLFTLIGLWGLWYGKELPLGTLGAIGSGFLPRVAFAGVLVIGAIKLVLGFLGRGEKISMGLHRGFLYICVGLLAFGYLLPVHGLIAALLALLGASEAAGTHEKSAKQFVILLVAIVAASVLIFKYVLGVPLPILPTWI